MAHVMARLQLFLAALWWGSLTVLGGMVVPLLFATLETPAQAGQMGARLFSAECWLGVVCGLLMLLAARRQDQSFDRVRAPSLWVLGGILSALLLEFAVAPHIVARENLMLWHNLGTALYVVQWGVLGRWLWTVPLHPDQST